MNPIALVLTLVSAVMHGTRDFVTKQSSDKEVFILWYTLVSLLLFAPLSAYIVLRDGTPPSTALTVCVCSVLCHFLYWLCLARALDHGDLSLVYPIMRASPALVLVGAMITIHETVSFQGAVGVLAVVLGVYMLHLKGFSRSDFVAPIRAIGTDTATRWALLTMIMVAGYSLLDKIGVGYVHPIVYLFLVDLGAFILFVPYVVCRKNQESLFEEWHRGKGSIVANGFFMMFGYVLILYAYRIERVSYVQAVRQISVIVAMLWGRQVLKEQYWQTRLTAACFVTIGTILIALST